MTRQPIDCIWKTKRADYFCRENRANAHFFSMTVCQGCISKSISSLQKVIHKTAKMEKVTYTYKYQLTIVQKYFFFPQYNHFVLLHIVTIFVLKVDPI